MSQFWRSEKAIAALLLVAVGAPAAAYPYHVCGTVYEMTSTMSGMMIRVDGALPDTCSASSSNWMLISQSHSSIIATTLSFWLTGRKNMCVYADGYAGNYCNVTQVDPYE